MRLRTQFGGLEIELNKIGKKISCSLSFKVFSLAHLNSVSSVNFWISVGVAKYSPCPLLLKEKVFDILIKLGTEREERRDSNEKS